MVASDLGKLWLRSEQSSSHTFNCTFYLSPSRSFEAGSKHLQEPRQVKR